MTFQCTITYSLRYGLGKHDRDLWPWDLIQILKWNWIALPGAVFTAVLARISVTILLIRLFGQVHRWFKWFLVLITSIQIISGLVLIPITFLQATPRRALYDIFMVDAYRWDPRVWTYTAYFFQCQLQVPNFRPSIGYTDPVLQHSTHSPISPTLPSPCTSSGVFKCLSKIA